ncbi:hypothetical protein HK100_009873 [Physocladia obscura]|uniref:Uncharacterized protein n=1 Tax=Physocladia obscura TaxID=109957 RepID=A0AAD5T3I6_9FUNG|nr:hypothetical protein HK100_009873 [Physocladia obscura]
MNSMNVAEISYFSELRGAIKTEFPKALADIDASQIQLYSNKKHVTDIEDIPKTCYEKLRDGGSALTVHIPPPVKKVVRVFIPEEVRVWASRDEKDWDKKLALNYVEVYSVTDRHTTVGFDGLVSDIIDELKIRKVYLQNYLACKSEFDILF